jgi:hypothetical protein
MVAEIEYCGLTPAGELRENRSGRAWRHFLPPERDGCLGSDHGG